MKTLEEYDIIKDSTDHESAKKYFLDLTKKYFDGKTPIEGNLFMLKWGASSRWSFFPDFAWGRIEMTTIEKTHSTLIL